MSAEGKNVDFVIVPAADGWAIESSGSTGGAYATKEAALEAAVGAASNAIKQGLGVTIVVPGQSAHHSSLGGPH